MKKDIFYQGDGSGCLLRSMILLMCCVQSRTYNFYKRALFPVVGNLCIGCQQISEYASYYTYFSFILKFCELFFVCCYRILNFMSLAIKYGIVQL